MDKTVKEGHSTLPLKEDKPSEINNKETQPVKVVIDEWRLRRELYELQLELQKFDTIFFEIYKYGEPQFTHAIPTAALQFVGKDLTPLKFIFNPDFWDSMDKYQRAFVVCHECLHSILEHGKRARSLMKKNIPMPILNVAMDLAINHLLVNAFGFDRDKLGEFGSREKIDFEALKANAKKGKKSKTSTAVDEEETPKRGQGCWVDTVFDRPVADDMSFEEYYQELLKGDNNLSCFLADVHWFISPDGQGCNIDDLPESIANSIREQMREASEGKGEESLKNKIEQTQGCGSTGNFFVEVNRARKVRPSKKWERIVNYFRRKGKEESDELQWIKQSKLAEYFPKNICLPHENITDDPNFSRTRINICLFLDVSGSCTAYKPHFLRGAESIPDKRFNKRMFVFADDCAEMKKNTNQYNVGGGTNFDSINDMVNTLIKDGKAPDLIFVITDGQSNGDYANFALAKKYNWFIIDGQGSNAGYKEGLPGDCYDLEDFFEEKLNI